MIGNDSQHLCVILNKFVDPLRQFWHHFGGLGTLMATLGPQEGYRSEKYIKNTVRGSGVGGHFRAFFESFFRSMLSYFLESTFSGCVRFWGPKPSSKEFERQKT